MVSGSMLKSLALITAAFAVGTPAQTATPSAPITSTTTTPSAAHALASLLDAEWDRWMRDDPTWASYLGDRRFNDRWPDASEQAMAASDAADERALQTLAAIDRTRLSDEERLNADVLADVLRTRRGTFRHKLWLVPLTPLGGVHNQESLVAALRFDTERDYADWLARLQRFPALVDQNIALLRRGVRERIVAPRDVLARIPPQIDAQIVDDPTTSALYRPFVTMPSSIAAATQAKLRAEAARAITAAMPALGRLKDVVVQEQLPAAPAAVGIDARAGGAEAYAFLVAQHTTTRMTPDEIHRLGLSEVKRIRAEMERIKGELGFKGSLADLFVHLRTDPKFFYATGDEILTATRALAKLIDGRLVKVLRTQPRTPYGVEPVPAGIAPDTTTAYYSSPAFDGSRAGTYYVNTYQPEMRPRWEMIPLCLHEAAPGHHTQIALAQELTGLPKARTEAAPYTAFVEGWGLYAESLGDDMGLYTDPYDRMGRLAYEMWRAIRLVVDTGMHSKGWTREQAVRYFLDNSPKTALDVRNEVDRYIVWPGQALAYKVGQLKLRELRARAEKKLGARFVLGAFHDVVLGAGPLPLALVEQRVDEWIAAGGSVGAPAK